MQLTMNSRDLQSNLLFGREPKLEEGKITALLYDYIIVYVYVVSVPTTTIYLYILELVNSSVWTTMEVGDSNVSETRIPSLTVTMK